MCWIKELEFDFNIKEIISLFWRGLKRQKVELWVLLKYNSMPRELSQCGVWSEE